MIGLKTFNQGQWPEYIAGAVRSYEKENPGTKVLGIDLLFERPDSTEEEEAMDDLD